MKKLIPKFLASLLFSFFLIGSIAAHGATMHIASSEDSYKLKETFSLGIFLSSAGQAANAVSATISFPDSIEISSISKTNLISFWIKEPSFSNEEGTITFEGVIFNPGFIGTSEEIVTLEVKPKKEGETSLEFLSGYILANDGKGSDITTSLIGTTFGIEKVEILREITPDEQPQPTIEPEPVTEPITEPSPTTEPEPIVETATLPNQPIIPELTEPDTPTTEITTTDITSTAILYETEEILVPTEIPKVEVTEKTPPSALTYIIIAVSLFVITVFVTTVILYRQKPKTKHQ
jgi:hypothetical protein